MNLLNAFNQAISEGKNDMQFVVPNGKQKGDVFFIINQTSKNVIAALVWTGYEWLKSTQSHHPDQITYLMDGEPDLNSSIHPDYPNVTWGSKKEFCQKEAKNYYDEGEAIESNPYIEYTWPWKWFNDAYRSYAE